MYGTFRLLSNPPQNHTGFFFGKDLDEFRPDELIQRKEGRDMVHPRRWRRRPPLALPPPPPRVLFVHLPLLTRPDGIAGQILGRRGAAQVHGRRDEGIRKASELRALLLGMGNLVVNSSKRPVVVWLGVLFARACACARACARICAFWHSGCMSHSSTPPRIQISLSAHLISFCPCSLVTVKKSNLQ